ncbi:hypothetical protein K1719_043520 [Acacia pycnantha]|nr:hypothetical protein K1719_043520 [Acacia pycnantha]
MIFKVLRNSEIYEFDITLGSRKNLIPAHSKGESRLPHIISLQDLFLQLSQFHIFVLSMERIRTSRL